MLSFEVFHNILFIFLGLIGTLVAGGVFVNLLTKKKEIMLTTFFLAPKQTLIEMKFLFLASTIFTVGFIFFTIGELVEMFQIVNVGEFLTQVGAIITILVVGRWWIRMRRVG